MVRSVHVHGVVASRSHWGPRMPLVAKSTYVLFGDPTV